MNLILSITSESYSYQEEAADACSFEKKVLCSLMQLESAKSAGQIPLIEWGWFETPGRAAEIKDCIPGMTSCTCRTYTHDSVIQMQQQQMTVIEIKHKYIIGKMNPQKQRYIVSNYSC